MGAVESAAKGIVSYEQGIRNGYLPDESSIEHEGIFYDYYFKTPKTNKLFDISFTYGISPDPLSKHPEYYLGLGLGSRLDGDGLKTHNGRPNLNLVICLDISGSMGSSFTGTSTDSPAESKLTIAKASLLVLLGQLRPEDSFGLITFNNTATVIQPLTPWKSTDVAKLKSDILALQESGGTTLSAGMEAAADMFTTGSTNASRVMFLTDLLISPGSNDENTLFTLTQKYVLRSIYYTYIGIGADFNTQLVSRLSKLRGTNYLSVNTAKEFKRHMEEEFDFLVTPCVSNVSVYFNSNVWEVERVYGSPGYEYPSKGKLVHIESTFPSAEDKENVGMMKGGIIVVKLKKIGSSQEPIQFRMDYEDSKGEKYTQEYTYNIPDWTGEKFENESLQKGVLLVRYVNFVKHFLRNENQFPLPISMETGILVPALVENQSKKERVERTELHQEWKTLFDVMLKYVEEQVELIADKSLERELKNLQDLSTAKVK